MDSNQVPEEWKHLPSLGVPDGAHNYTKGGQNGICFHILHNVIFYIWIFFSHIALSLVFFFSHIVLWDYFTNILNNNTNLTT